MDDWRLDFVRKFRGVEFKLSPWKSLSREWDHDHCVACGAKLSDKGGSDVLREGYATTVNYVHGPYYHWVCSECFHDLKDKVGWVEVK